MSSDTANRRLVVRGTEILATDIRQRYREKIARITLDSMVQFVGLLDAHGTVLEINKVALDAVGITLADVERKPFWTTFWWQVSEEIALTGYGQDSDRRRAREAGFHRHLVKPVDIDAIEAALLADGSLTPGDAGDAWMNDLA